MLLRSFINRYTNRKWIYLLSKTIGSHYNHIINTQHNNDNDNYLNNHNGYSSQRYLPAQYYNYYYNQAEKPNKSTKVIIRNRKNVCCQCSNHNCLMSDKSKEIHTAPPLIIHYSPAYLASQFESIFHMICAHIFILILFFVRLVYLIHLLSLSQIIIAIEQHMIDIMNFLLLRLTMVTSPSTNFNSYKLLLFLTCDIRPILSIYSHLSLNCITTKNASQLNVSFYKYQIF